MFGLGLNLSYSRGQFMNLPIQTQLTTITYADSSVETFDITVIPSFWQISNSNIVSVVVGNAVTSIDEWAFNGCTNLTSITIPDSVTYIGEHTFDGCTSLTSITIPDSINTISIRTFNNCTSLTSITIPDSVTYIKEYAFYSCTSLTSITIPNSVTFIGEAILFNCSSLNTLNCYVARSVIDVSTTLVGTASPFTIYARASDSTWTAGSAMIGGKTVTVVKNL